MTSSVHDLDWSSWDAVLFDLDGVITPTAEVHMRAWSTMFNTFLEQRGEAPYTDEDYFAHVDGKPRYDGVAAFLASRGIDLPWGEPGDSPGTETVCGLGNRKNNAFGEVLARDGVEPYPGSVELVRRLHERDVRVAIVSSSANAPDVLRAAGILDQFETVVDGAVARDRKLPGKPRPDTYLYAAQLLDTAPARAVVVEDALSGVQAGAAGSFGLVVGVDRGAGEAALRDGGADVVVSDLAELVPGLVARREVTA
jgi:beta-phosphoglucomutase family hydrolase